MAYETASQLERVIIVGVQTKETDDQFQYSMEELAQLTENAQGQVVGQVSQKRQHVDARTLVGKGKLNELRQEVDLKEATTVIFNQELTPSQGRNIQSEIDAKVIDRIQLILDIFALRARSKAGRLQVELAQLEYLLPRLRGQGEELSRLGGGIGTRGPGETKLETDRRHILNQIADVKKELREIEKQRDLNREERKRNNIFQIGIIGYTNAGKSTLLNQLTDADTYEKDQLFATLDPLTRQLTLPSGMDVTLTDTVGFIQDLPTQLIEAFQSTLEETRNADLILHVLDASAGNLAVHEETVMELLSDLDMDHIPILHIYNKKDLIEGPFTPSLFPNYLMSARQEDDVEGLKAYIEDSMQAIMEPYDRLVDASRGDLLIDYKRHTILIDEDFIPEENAYRISGYAKKDSKYLAKALDKD